MLYLQLWDELFLFRCRKLQHNSCILPLAHQYAQMLESGRYSTVLELAKALKLDRSYVARTLSLVNLAPDIIVAVMQGKTPPEMTLAKAANNLPEDWQEQRELFGF